MAGILLVLSLIGGGLGEFYIPGKMIVSGDAAATAHNVIASNSLFRLGFATYMIEGLCDIALSLVFYVLLRPVNKNLSLMAAFFGLVSTAVFAVFELFYFLPTHILGGAAYLKTFSPEQLNTLSLLSLKIYAIGGTLFMAFYGTAMLIRGYLIYRSAYLPKSLGILLALAGAGFVAKNFAMVLAPHFPSDYFLMFMPIAALSLLFWFLVKGVDESKMPAT